MRVCLLLGSTKPKGNTEELCKPFVEELKDNDVEVDFITLYDKELKPCIGCNTCNKSLHDYGCVHKDDMQAIVDILVKADVLVMATPSYTWQAATPLKTVMDRMIGLIKENKGKETIILNANQPYALIATCGDKIEEGIDLISESVKRMCEYSNRPYLGYYAYRDLNGIEDFRSQEAILGARDFAKKIIDR
jgi:multimeric flavodoxin WrbA